MNDLDLCAKYDMGRLLSQSFLKGEKIGYRTIKLEEKYLRIVKDSSSLLEKLDKKDLSFEFDDEMSLWLVCWSDRYTEFKHKLGDFKTESNHVSLSFYCDREDNLYLCVSTDNVHHLFDIPHFLYEGCVS